MLSHAESAYSTEGVSRSVSIGLRDEFVPEPGNISEQAERELAAARELRVVREAALGELAVEPDGHPVDERRLVELVHAEEALRLERQRIDALLVGCPDQSPGTCERHGV